MFFVSVCRAGILEIGNPGRALVKKQRRTEAADPEVSGTAFRKAVSRQTGLVSADLAEQVH